MISAKNKKKSVAVSSDEEENEEPESDPEPEPEPIPVKKASKLAAKPTQKKGMVLFIIQLIVL